MLLCEASEVQWRREDKDALPQRCSSFICIDILTWDNLNVPFPAFSPHDLSILVDQPLGLIQPVGEQGSLD